MSFYEILRGARSATRAPGESDVVRALLKETPGERDFAALLSPAGAAHLEAMARRASEITLRYFGRTISLYAPLYLSSFCDNECAYCGFRRSSPLVRRRLSPAEVEEEAAALADSGIRHVLMLTGESRGQTPVAYLTECAGILARRFSSVSAEVYALEEREYSGLVKAGADGLTLYQETYDERLYRRLHISGPKRDYRYRLDAPERACRAGMRAVNVGALLGLSDFRSEVFAAGLHAAWLQKRYPGVEVGVSLPRLRPVAGSKCPADAVSDRDLVQAMTALRIFLPRAGVNISTRESGELRANLIGLGVTRMSAGSRTTVGGYAAARAGGRQFSVADGSGVEAVVAMIRARGHQPVMKDWQALQEKT